MCIRDRLAVGTSLPELTTAIASLVKKAHGVAIGNVIGANILNIILVTATSAVINPIQVQAGNGVPGGLMILQIPLIFLIVAVLLFNISISKDRIPRICGLIMLVLYIVCLLYTSRCV